MKNEVAVGDTNKVSGFLVIKTFENGVLVSETPAMPNKVVSSDGYGRNLLMRQLAGITTYPITINSFSLGTGTTAPTDADTALGTSTVSGITITSITVTNAQIVVDAYVTDASLANGTYSELGVFCTGRLLARILIAPSYTKTTGQDTLFTYTLNFTG